MNNEYSLAVFEDGTTEMIPKSWMHDYLAKDEPSSSSSNENESELEEPPSKINTRLRNYKFGKSGSTKNEETESLYENDIRKSLITISKFVSDNKEQIEKLNKKVEALIDKINGNNHMEGINSASTESRLAISRLQKSVDRLICIATGEPEPEVNISEPAETLREFLQIEDYIKIKENYDEMVHCLSKIGGKTVESATRKIWKRLCTTQLASKICWTGANGKYCLKNLTINNVVRDAVLITHPDGKESEIQRATMLWFSHAQDRLRARKNNPPIIGFKNAF